MFAQKNTLIGDPLHTPYMAITASLRSYSNYVLIQLVTLDNCTYSGLIGSSVESVSPNLSISQSTLQCVVVVFKAFEFQKMFWSFAALASGGQIGDLDGGRGAADRRSRQVLSCRLVMLV